MARLGRTFHDMEMQDLFTKFHLASPPRDRAQIAFGTRGGGSRVGRQQGFVWRLVFIASAKAESLPHTSRRFFNEPWAVMYHTEVWSVDEWAKLISRYDLDHQAVVTWDGTEWSRKWYAKEDILNAARRSYDRAVQMVQAKVQ